MRCIDCEFSAKKIQRTKEDGYKNKNREQKKRGVTFGICMITEIYLLVVLSVEKPIYCGINFYQVNSITQIRFEGFYPYLPVRALTLMLKKVFPQSLNFWTVSL